MTQLHYPNWRELVVYSAQGPQPTALYETDKVRVIVVGLNPGQRIPPHPEDAAAVFYFLQGTGWLLIEQERFAVQAGATAIAPAGAVRGMEAETALVFLATRIVP